MERERAVARQTARALGGEATCGVAVNGDVVGGGAGGNVAVGSDAGSGAGTSHGNPDLRNDDGGGNKEGEPPRAQRLQRRHRQRTRLCPCIVPGVAASARQVDEHSLWETDLGVWNLLHALARLNRSHP